MQPSPMEMDRMLGNREQEMRARRDRPPTMTGDVTSGAEDALCVQCGAAMKAHVLRCGAVEVLRQRACARCIERMEAETHAKSAPALSAEERRAREWEAVCPPEYRDFDRARLEADIAARGKQGLPRRLDAAGKLTEIPVAQALDEILGWDGLRDGRGLCITGDVGRGKTMLVFAMLRRHFMAGMNVVALTGARFSATHAALSAGGGREAFEWLEKLEVVPVLFWDDLDKARMTDATLTAFYNILEERKSHRRPVCFTSNLRGDDLVRAIEVSATKRGIKDGIGASIVRRLRQLAEGWTL